MNTVSLIIGVLGVISASFSAGFFFGGRIVEAHTFVKFNQLEDNDDPTIHIFCDYNDDEVKSFYEIPDTIAKLIQDDDTKLTFVECLAHLIDPHKKESK